MKRNILTILFLFAALVMYAQDIKVTNTSCVRSGFDVLFTVTIINKTNETLRLELNPRTSSYDDLKSEAFGDSSERYATSYEKLAGKTGHSTVEAPQGVPLKATIRIKNVPKELKKFNNVLFVVSNYCTLFQNVEITDGPTPSSYRNTDKVRLGETKPGTSLKIVSSYKTSVK